MTDEQHLTVIEMERTPQFSLTDPRFVDALEHYFVKKGILD